MRIFGKANAAIDRFDRAEWFTWPFDGAFPAATAAVPAVGFVLFRASPGFVLGDDPCGFDAGPPRNGLILTD